MVDSKQVVELLPLVKKIASRFDGGILTFDDLVQEGAIATIRAIENYNNGKVKLQKFSAYCRFAIKNKLIDKIKEYNHKSVKTESIEDYE